ncbi:hypothetical protein GSI_13421 [Ganoderma sinense ZZ0214-1]|uniref:CxC2-like cysteine cluster KDZ transposase-associated domain-containing protein n=1 Tax=Ganoderma sinense ZZ0214-1 TaxID=1077348 RepID=A0A2G8RQ92_9APHY|nr:hypothetical protein GSI_13421 [Ganoderma sinense ZZ0214-1]
MGPKRAQNSSLHPNKRARTFKVRVVDTPPPVPQPGPSAGSTTYVQDTRLYQVYSLTDGRVGMRHASSKVTVTVPLPPEDTTDRRGIDSEVGSVLDSFSVEHAEALDQPSFEPHEKKKRKRPELHALRWDGQGFRRLSLRELGLTVQLGHDGDACNCPAPKLCRIAVCDITGTHQVDVCFCECLDEDMDLFTPEWVQLFRCGWFPATTNRPATVFTFCLLDFFQELNFQAKTNLYDFWKTLERVTDNTGASAPLNRYMQISHSVRLWRHLVLLKCAGHRHDPTGPEGTQQGELAIKCPACPQPGKNLPADWESAPDGMKWLYTLFLMCDVNFRAKLKDHGFDDFELGSGWSYFAETRGYQRHLEEAGDQDERNECSAEHQAILKANLRREGYLTSGVGAVLCARHVLVRKNAAGDVPNGEKFAIMDFLVFSTIVHLMLMYLISYDITCQWHKRLPICMQALPSHLQRDLEKDSVRFAIPKKHIRVHGANHSQFSLNYLPKVGRTYGEGIEAH